MLVCTYPCSKIPYMPTSPFTASEQFLIALWEAVSQAIILSKSPNKTETHRSHAVRFLFQSTPRCLDSYVPVMQKIWFLAWNICRNAFSYGEGEGRQREPDIIISITRFCYFEDREWQLFGYQNSLITTIFRDDYFIYSISISFFLIFIFIHLFLAVLGLRCCTRAFSSCSERGLLLVAARGLLIAVASLVAEHGV